MALTTPTMVWTDSTGEGQVPGTELGAPRLPSNSSVASPEVCEDRQPGGRMVEGGNTDRKPLRNRWLGAVVGWGAVRVGCSQENQHFSKATQLVWELWQELAQGCKSTDRSLLEASTMAPPEPNQRLAT